jgi:hypothetical protein
MLGTETDEVNTRFRILRNKELRVVYMSHITAAVFIGRKGEEKRREV